MRFRDWGTAPLTWPASGALAVAVVCLAWSAMRFAHAGTVPDDPATRDVLPVPRIALPTPVVAHDVPLDDDPFSPDRRAPERRYAMPGDAPNGDEVTTGSPPAPRPTLLGTAVASDGGGFATARLGTDPPKILHVGDRLGPYTLDAVARGHATFADVDGERFDVRASALP